MKQERVIPSSRTLTFDKPYPGVRDLCPTWTAVNIFKIFVIKHWLLGTILVLGTGIMPVAKIQSFLLMNLADLSGENNDSKWVFLIEVTPTLRPNKKGKTIDHEMVFMAKQMMCTMSQRKDRASWLLQRPWYSLKTDLKGHSLCLCFYCSSEWGLPHKVGPQWKLVWIKLCGFLF